MSNVVSLAAAKQERALIWACNCGCTVHRVYADGRIECGSCEEIANGFEGEWRERLPPAPEDPRPLDADNFKAVFGLDGSEAFLRRHIKDDDLQFVVLGYDDGSLSTWRDEDFDTPDRIAWAGRILRKARKLLFSGPKR